MIVSVSFSIFVACLAIVQVLLPLGLTFLGSVASCSPSFASFVSSEFTSNVSSNLGLELRLVLLVLVSVPCCLLDFATVSDCIHQLVLVD